MLKYSADARWIGPELDDRGALILQDSVFVADLSVDPELIRPRIKQSQDSRKTTEKRSLPNMNRTSLTVLLAVSMAASVGCASKNYVRQETTPLINKTNELDDMTAKNLSLIHI